MQRLYEVIDKLVIYAQDKLELESYDVDYVKNSIFALFDFNTYAGTTVTEFNESLSELLNQFDSLVLELNLAEEGDLEYLNDQVMGYLSLLPSQINKKFNSIKAESSEKATEWLYQYCVNNDYVKKAKLDQNIRFDNNGLVITINKAKPEFRDAKKAKLGNSVAGGYPRCTICHENEGFKNRNKKTLRTVDMTLAGQKWFWQFSPYGYFYQHGITVSYEHTPMHVDNGTFYRLMDFVDEFPHYFIGSNAALPRIGGSVLAHDHYQGGGEILPMHKAGAKMTFASSAYPDAIVEIVNWPNTVFRVVSFDKETIANISEKIREKWVNYTDLEQGIIAVDEEGIHSAVSPTVVKTARGYEMSIILRNNITTEEYPDGVFHAHPEFHIIKKESIGLIEAQGLFILPGRLENELNQIKMLIHEGKGLTEELKDFHMIYDEIVALCSGDYSLENLDKAVEDELGSVCSRILDNTAVFKDIKYSIQFLQDLGFVQTK